MRRREFAKLAAATVMWPAVASAQKALPVIGYLSSRSPSDSQNIIDAFRQGLNEAGFVDKHNVLIEYRFAEDNFDRLPELTAELVRRQINVLVATGGTVSAVKAKTVLPETIPMAFSMGGDPVKLGIVKSLNRPGGNITGVTFLVNGLAAKALDILHELLPKATTVGFFLNPKNPNSESDMRDVEETANKFRKKLVVVKASTENEIDLAFTSLIQQQVEGLLVQPDSLFTDRRVKIVMLAARQALPAVYTLRDFAVAGGLIAYGTNITEANHQLGIQTGRILKGDKPADLPVMQSTRFELVVNLKTAKALGLEIPPILLAGANEVIE